MEDDETNPASFATEESYRLLEGSCEACSPWDNRYMTSDTIRNQDEELITDGGTDYPHFIAIGFDMDDMEGEELERTVESLEASVGYNTELSKSLERLYRDTDNTELQNHRPDSGNFDFYGLAPKVYMDVSEMEFSDVKDLERRIRQSVPNNSYVERLSETQVPESLEEFSLRENLLEEEDVSGWRCC